LLQDIARKEQRRRAKQKRKERKAKKQQLRDRLEFAALSRETSEEGTPEEMEERNIVVDEDIEMILEQSPENQPTVAKEDELETLLEVGTNFL